MKGTLSIFAITFANYLSLCDFNGDTSSKFVKVPSCPHAKDWADREKQYQCEKHGKIYTCLMDNNLQLHEGCMIDEKIDNATVGCPFITVRNSIPILSHQESFHACPKENPGCPPLHHGDYRISEIYKYPACISGKGISNDTADTSIVSVIPVSTIITTESSKTINCSNNVSDNEDDDWKIKYLYFLLPSFFIIVFVVVIAIWLYLRKSNRKRHKSKLSTQENRLELDEIRDNNDQVCTDHTASDPIQRPLLACGGPPKLAKAYKCIYDELDGYLNAGQFKNFEKRIQACKDIDSADLKCLMSYLKVHSYQHQGEYNKAKEEFNIGITLCKHSSEPLFFQVKLMTAKARIHVNTGEEKDLENTLDDIVSNIERKKSLFFNEIMGWLFFDQSRLHRDNIQFLNKDSGKLEEHLQKALHKMEKAVQCFNGYNRFENERYVGVSKMELIALHLRWLGKDIKSVFLKPTANDMIKCKILLDDLEYSNIPMDVEMRAQYLKAKVIYCFRAGIDVRTKEYLQELSKLIKKHNRKGMLEDVQMMKRVML